MLARQDSRIGEIVSLYLQGLSYAAIGRRFNPPLSRQRIQQLIADIKDRLPERTKAESIKVTCDYCKKEFSPAHKDYEYKRPEKFCSTECRHKAHYSTVTCAICNRQLEKLTKLITENQPQYCGKVCYYKRKSLN